MTTDFCIHSVSDILYLRGRNYDSYDGTKWTATEVGSGKDMGWATATVLPRGTVQVQTAQKLDYY